MADEKNTNVEKVTVKNTVVEVPQSNEAQANPEQFLKDFNWHNYEEGIDPVDDDKLVEFEKLVASNFVDTLDDQVVDGTVNYNSSELRFSGSWDRTKGKMSFMKIYNKELSQDEVLQNYNATAARFK